ncbi:hypothetical protein F1559_000274 [Cyanidiococcus yangmingshanensis]|uniref:Uncharacterized protein n=1 Tax=Cyanidiococcus yangmingshanensis TaxID=2690220 RepID=A0A7J7ILR1_9RHOD|nr:hypothetical protein F1559_000274 [Cyanidiococcus yangmingshanensis]
MAWTLTQAQSLSSIVLLPQIHFNCALITGSSTKFLPSPGYLDSWFGIQLLVIPDELLVIAILSKRGFHPTDSERMRLDVTYTAPSGHRLRWTISFTVYRCL